MLAPPVRCCCSGRRPDHESQDNAVESEAVIETGLARNDEVCDSLWCGIGIELEGDFAFVGLAITVCLPVSILPSERCLC